MPIQLPDQRSTPSAQQRGGLRYQGAAAPDTFSGARIQAPITASQGGEALGQSLMQAGEKLYQRAEQDRLKTASLETAKAKSYFLRENLRIQGELEQDPDYANYEKNYTERTGEAYKNALGMVQDPEARSLLDLELKDSGARGASAVKSLSHRKSVQARTGLFQETIEESIDNALAAPDEQTRKQALDTVGESIVGAYKEGLIDEGEMKKISREAKEKYGERWASIQDPSTLLGLLEKNSPLNVRNNNPGNMRGNDGNFMTFPDKDSGLKAMKDDLGIKVSGKSRAMEGKFGQGYSPTLANVISTWAPPSENDTNSYIQTVSRETGIKPDQVLTEADIEKIMPAMIKVEGGPEASRAFSKTGSPLDFMPAEKRIALRNNLVKSAMGTEIDADPMGAFEKIKSGQLDNIMTPTEKTEYMQKARSEALTQNGQRQEDPAGYAIRKGAIPLENLDLGNPENLAAQIGGRMPVIDNLNQQFGSPLNPLTKDEAQELQQKMSELSPPEKLVYLKSLRDGIDGDQGYRGIVEQIRKDSPVTAWAGAFLDSDRDMTIKKRTISPGDVAAGLLEGEQLINPPKGEKLFPMPTDKDLRPVFDQKYGAVFKGLPQYADEAYRAANAYYAHLMAKKGDYSGEPEEKTYKIALESVIGQTVDVNGPVLAPWGMDKNDFLSTLAQVSTETLKKSGFDTNRFRFDDLSFSNTGIQNIYAVYNGGSPLIDKKGSPVMVDLNINARVE